MARDTPSSTLSSPTIVQESSPNPNDYIVQVEDSHGEIEHNGGNADSEEDRTVVSQGMSLNLPVLKRPSNERRTIGENPAFKALELLSRASRSTPLSSYSQRLQRRGRQEDASPTKCEHFPMFHGLLN